MYELTAGEIAEEFEEAIKLHSQFGPIMYVAAKGRKPMFCYLVDPLNDGKLSILDEYGRIHVTDGKKKKKILLREIQKIMFFGHEELIEIFKSLLNGVDDLVSFNDVIEKQIRDMKSKILDLGLTLCKPWIRL